MSTSITLDKVLTPTYYKGYYNLGLPPQTVSIDEKNTDDWKAGCMRFMVQEARAHSVNKIKDVKKYKMLSDQYDYSENHKWALDPLNLGDEAEDLYGTVEPIQHYPIVNTPLNTILGERINRVTQYYCVSDAPESRNEYYRQKSDMLFDSVQSQIMGRVMNSIIMDAQKQGTEISDEFIQQAQQQAQQQMPEAIQDYMDTDYADIIEKVHNRIVKSIMRRNDLEAEFIEGFRHGTICAKEFYSYTIVNKKLLIKNLSPFSVFYHKSPSNRWVSEGQFAGYRLFLTPSSLIDVCREHLSIEDIKMLEDKLNPSRKAGGINSLTGIKSISYDTSVFADWHGNTFDNVNHNILNSMIDEFQITGRSTYNRSAFGLFEMVQAFWKSYRKVGILEAFAPDGSSMETLVDENYEPDEDAGEFVSWFYLNQVYQGTCVGDDLLLNVGPFPFQIFDENNPDYSPLPIEGAEYNNYNGEPISIMDLMMAWAELYDITANELKKDMKKAMGKVMFMSVDHLPNIPGFDMNKWMYWVKEFGVAWVGAASNKSNFSHFSSQDMSFAEQIVSKMNMLDKIKQNCDAFGGFSQPRVAGTASAPTQGQDQQKLTASVNQTEYYFWKHSKICEKVLTQALNIEKLLVVQRKDYNVLYDDLEQKYIEADLDKTIAAEVGLHVINGTQELAKREALRGMAVNAAAKTAQPEDMAEIILADTQNEIKKALKSISRKNNELEQQKLQQQQAQIESNEKLAAEKNAWEREKLYATLESEERQEFIRTFGGRNASPTDDLNENDIPDALEMGQLFEQTSDNMRKHQRENRKMDIEERTKDKELSLKEKEIAVKKEKNQIDLKNQANDLAISRLQSKNKPPRK